MREYDALGEVIEAILDVSYNGWGFADPAGDEIPGIPQLPPKDGFHYQGLSIKEPAVYRDLERLGWEISRVRMRALRRLFSRAPVDE